MSKVEKYTQEAIRIANDNRHGYSQYNRWGNPDYDCSSLVCSVTQNAGIPTMTYGATYTGNMYGAFLKAGFKDVTRSINLRTGAGLKRGDILLNTSKHTEIYIGGGKMVGARRDERGGIVGRIPGDQDGKEIATGWYYNYPWNVVLRYTDTSKTTSKPANQANKKPSGVKFIKNEKATARFLADTNIRDYPSTKKGHLVGSYKKGGTVKYDSVYEGNGYRWISYIAWSGMRRYIAYRKLSGNTKPWARFY